MGAPNLGITINCNSDCHNCCPRVLRVFCCCCCSVEDNEEKKVDEVAQREFDKKQNSPTILRRNVRKKSESKSKDE